MTAEAARPVIFGEALFDCFPDGRKVLGGAPFNVAWHLQAFGQQPLFISAVGDDGNGSRILDKMTDWGMDTSGVQITADYPTGIVDISLQDGEPSYDIVDQQAYDHIAGASLPVLQSASILYHGSLALRNDVSSSALESLQASIATPVFIDVNLRPPWWDRDRVTVMMRHATWVKLNQGELEELVAGEGDLEDRALRLLHDSELQGLILTRGESGADFISEDGRATVVPAGGATVIDTVGAGDAFTSVLLLGLVEGWDIQQTLQRAQAFASAIVGVRGATVDERAFYDELMQGW